MSKAGMKLTQAFEAKLEVTITIHQEGPFLKQLTFFAQTTDSTITPSHTNFGWNNLDFEDDQLSNVYFRHQVTFSFTFDWSSSFQTFNRELPNQQNNIKRDQLYNVICCY